MSPRPPFPRALHLPGALILASACGGGSDAASAPSAAAADEAVWFRDVTAARGLDFVHESGATGKRLLPEMNSAGVGLLDVEGDGDLDLYLVNGTELAPDPVESERHTNRLYRQGPDGRFADATAATGLGDRGYGMGVAVGDVDNDGDEDLVATNVGPDRLYVNDGAGVFTVAGRGPTTDGFSSSAAFLDFDRDGFLDLFVCVYVAFDPEKPCFNGAGEPDYCGPLAFPPLSDALFHNDRAGGLVDVSERAGITKVQAAGLGVTCADLDADGWQDVYVANDGYANHLWTNAKDGTFAEEALFQGVALNMNGQPEAGMGVVAADFDGDLDLDLFVTHLREETNTLYLNQGAALGFVDATGQLGAGAASIPYTGFGTAAADFDQDGRLDVVVVNGAVLRGQRHPGVEVPAPWDRYAEPNLLFVGEGGGRLREASDLAPELCARPEVSRGLAAGDLDGDGDLDLLLGNVNAPARLFENTAARGSWLEVRCVHPAWRRDAIGARVEVHLPDGRRQLCTVGGGQSFLSATPAVAHFGLGDAEQVERLVVHWPDGRTETFPGGAVDRRVVLVHGEGES